MRASPVFSETSMRPSLVRTTAVKKPRTEWGCQPVAFMTAAMVAPCFRWSIASTRACFESERPCLAERRRASFPVFTSWASVSLFGDSFFDDIVGILHSVRSGVSRRHHRSPAQARKPAGQDPQRAVGALRGRTSDAPFPAEVQSFLDSFFVGLSPEATQVWVQANPDAAPGRFSDHRLR